MANETKQIMVIIPLPLRYNPDENGKSYPIEKEKFDESLLDIANQLGGGKLYSPKDREDLPGYLGMWVDAGVSYRDPFAIIETIVEDSPEIRRWVLSFARDVLLDRFVQLAICVQFIGPIEMIIVEKREVSK